MNYFFKFIFSLLIVFFSLFAESSVESSIESSEKVSKSQLVIPEWLETSIQTHSYKNSFLYFLSTYSQHPEYQYAFSRIMDFLDDKNYYSREEAIYILKQWSFFSKISPSVQKQFYQKLVQMLVSDSSSYVQTEAFWALYNSSFSLDLEEQKVLVKGLQNKGFFARKMAYRILSKQNALFSSIAKDTRLALKKEKNLQFSRFNTSDISDITKLLYNESPKVRRLEFIKLKNMHPSQELSQFLGDLLRKGGSLDNLSMIVNIVKELRLLDQYTIPPLLSILAYTSEDNIREQIVNALKYTRFKWDSAIFERLLNTLFKANFATEEKIYRVLTSILWSNSEVQKKIQMIFTSDQLQHRHLLNSLFATLIQHRVATLWILHRVPYLSVELIKEFVLDSLFSSAISNRIMAIKAIETLPFLHNDTRVQKILIRIAKEDSMPLVRTSVMRLFSFVKPIDSSILADIVYISAYDSSERVRANAIYVFGTIDWLEKFSDLQKPVVNQLIRIIKNPPVEIGKINSNIISYNSQVKISKSEWVATISAFRNMDLKNHIEVQRMITEFLKSSDYKIRRLIYSALQKIAPSDSSILSAMKRVEPEMEAIIPNYMPPSKDDNNSCQKIF